LRKNSPGERVSGRSFLCTLHDAVASVHLYPTVQETLIKLLAFLISWIISILCYYNSVGGSGDGSAVLFGGSVVLFCISILLEVFDRIDMRAAASRRLLTVSILVWTIGCLALGLVIIFVKAANVSSNLLVTMCVIPVCMYAFDAITYFFIPPDAPRAAARRNQEDKLKGVRVP